MNRRAAVYKRAGEFVIEEIPIPDPEANGAVVKVLHAGLCMTDVDLWLLGSDFLASCTYPWIGGHEIAGVVHALGENAKGVAVGDRVMVYPWHACGQCHLCKKGRTINCPQNIVYNSQGMTKAGGFQSFINVSDAAYLVKLPEDMSTQVACMLPCSGVTAYSAVKNVQEHLRDITDVTGSSRLLIIGAGGLGMWAIAIAKVLLPKSCHVGIADIKTEKLELAKKAGADSVVLWDPEGDENTLVEKTVEALGGRADAIIDLVNVQRTISLLIGCAEQGAYWSMIGVMAATAEFPLRALVIKKLIILGTICGNIKDLEELLDLVQKHKLKPPAIVPIDLDQVGEYAQLLHDGKIQGRAIIQHKH